MIAVVLAAAQVVSLAQAEANTRAHFPALRVAAAQVAAQKALHDEAVSGYLPQLSASASYYPLQTTNAGQAILLGARLPANISPSQIVLGQTASLGINATQLIYDFNQTIDKIRSADALVKSQEENENTVWNAALIGTRAAYFLAQQNRALIRVAEQNVEDQQKHVEQMAAFVELGTHAPIDLAQARQQRAAAEYVLIQARGAYDQARANLQQAMGLDSPPDYEVADEQFPPVQGEESATDALLPEALGNRPEIRAVQDQIDAQRLAAAANREAWLPAIDAAANASGNWTEVGGGSAIVPRAGLGFTLAWPFFLGGFTQAAARQSEAVLVQLQAQLETSRQQVRNDVEIARVGISTARGQVASAQEALVYAREQLRLAEGQYAAGVGIALAVFDAEVAVATSGGQLAQSQAAIATARAQLLKALGRERW